MESALGDGCNILPQKFGNLIVEIMAELTRKFQGAAVLKWVFQSKNEDCKRIIQLFQQTLPAMQEDVSISGDVEEFMKYIQAMRKLEFLFDAIELENNLMPSLITKFFNDISQFIGKKRYGELFFSGNQAREATGPNGDTEDQLTVPTPVLSMIGLNQAARVIPESVSKMDVDEVIRTTCNNNMLLEENISDTTSNNIDIPNEYLKWKVPTVALELIKSEDSTQDLPECESNFLGCSIDRESNQSTSAENLISPTTEIQSMTGQSNATCSSNANVCVADSLSSSSRGNTVAPSTAKAFESGTNFPAGFRCEAPGKDSLTFKTPGRGCCTPKALGCLGSPSRAPGGVGSISKPPSASNCSSMDTESEACTSANNIENKKSDFGVILKSVGLDTGCDFSPGGLSPVALGLCPVVLDPDALGFCIEIPPSGQDSLLNKSGNKSDEVNMEAENASEQNASFDDEEFSQHDSILNLAEGHLLNLLGL